MLARSITALFALGAIVGSASAESLTLKFELPSGVFTMTLNDDDTFISDNGDFGTYEFDEDNLQLCDTSQEEINCATLDGFQRQLGFKTKITMLGGVEGWMTIVGMSG